MENIKAGLDDLTFKAGSVLLLRKTLISIQGEVQAHHVTWILIKEEGYGKQNRKGGCPR